MACLLLRERDVDELLDMPLALQVMEDAFRQLAAGLAHNVPRSRTRGDSVVLHSMSASANYLGLVGWKQYISTPAGTRFHVGLYSQASGEWVALIEANRLGQLRTGAVTGLAARLLSNSPVEEVGIFGSGWQAQSQLEAVVTACGIKRAKIYSPNADRRQEFATRAAAQFAIEATAVSEPQSAASDLPLIITATTSRQPVLHGDWLAPGALVCAIGSNWLHKSEVDVQTVRRAERIVCDSIACCQIEAGDFTAPLQQGVFDWSQAVGLAAVVERPTLGRQRAESIILFKSVGMAIEDVALAGKLLELARAAGRGEELPL